MSVSAQLAKRGHQMEYFLCIEGVGWPVTETDLSDGFAGDVWTTADFDGDLATQLGCTVHGGLEVQGALTDGLDPLTCEYSVGQMTFVIVPQDDWWADNFTPHLKGASQTTVSQAMEYSSTTLRLADGTDFADDTVVWLGGREAVLLDNKSLVSGTEYEYTGITRGYLGTLRGRTDLKPLSSAAFVWPVGANAYANHQYWADRYCELYAHVPGEAASECRRWYSGKLKNISMPVVGEEVRLSVTGDLVRLSSSTYRAARLVCASNTYSNSNPQARVQSVDQPLTQPELGWLRELRIVYKQDSEDAERGDGKYALAAAYRYRTEPGGTAGMRAAWDAGNLQALDSSNGNDEKLIMRYLRIEGKLYKALRAADPDGDPELILVEVFSSLGFNDPVEFDSAGQPFVQEFARNTQCRFCLDNFGDTWETNHYAVNKEVSRHPINVFLSHATTRPDEYFIGDATAGSTTTVVNFTSAAPANDVWIGAALHCVEGLNKGECRVIIDSTTTSITVESAFSNAPSVGDEYQVRNSIYDTLPLGFGLGIAYSRIDIESFELIRDRYIPDARVGRFVLGVQETFNLWQMLVENILQPYGVAIYIDRSTGKITGRYVGQAVGDGIIDDYITVPDADLMEIGDIDYRVAKPIGTVALTVRALEEKVVGVRTVGNTGIATNSSSGRQAAQLTPVAEAYTARIPATIGGDTISITHRRKDFEGYSDTASDRIEISALLNTPDDCGTLSMRAQALAKAYGVPPPQTHIILPPEYIDDVGIGKFLLVTKDTGPVNPYLGSRGWSQVVCFVIGTQLLIGDGPGIRCQVQILTDLNGGKVAPAALLDGAKTGSDGTSDYFIVSGDEYVNDDINDNDMYYFAVGDRIAVFDADGSVAHTTYTIRAFGANDQSDPEDASTNIIRINEAAPALTSEEYVSFAVWSASNTARMEKYAAYADSNGDLAGGDSAKDYV